MKQTAFYKQTLAGALVAAGLAVACSGTVLPTASTPTTEWSSATASTVDAVAGSGSSCATGDGVNDACACDADAHLSCAGFYGTDWESYARTNGYTTASWKYGLLDCLGQHDVTATCRASLDRRAVLNERMMASCATYCRGVAPQPGAEPCVDHLKSIYASLDSACRIALDAHEAAKALKGRGAL